MKERGEREEGERGREGERGVRNTHLRKVGPCCGVLLLKNYLTSSPSGLSMVTLIPPNGRPLDMNLILSDVVRVVGPVQHTHVCAVIMVCITIIIWRYVCHIIYRSKCIGLLQHIFDE